MFIYHGIGEETAIMSVWQFEIGHPDLIKGKLDSFEV